MIIQAFLFGRMRDTIIPKIQSNLSASMNRNDAFSNTLTSKGTEIVSEPFLLAIIWTAWQFHVQRARRTL